MRSMNMHIKLVHSSQIYNQNLSDTLFEELTIQEIFINWDSKVSEKIVNHLISIM